MTKFTVSEIASQRLDEIFAYTRDNWGTEHAEAYIRGLFGCFEQIGRHEVVGRAIPAESGVEGYYHRYDRHYVYWRRLSDQRIGIVTILHERMHQIDRFRADAEG